MNERTKEKQFNLLTVLLFFVFIFIFAGNISVAQDSVPSEELDEASVNSETEEEVDDEDVVVLDRVITTGSRLLKETYESISPVQVITAQASREVGQIDAAAILQGTTAASGQQIDLTFSGFVLDNGPGAQTLSFRGLDARRTLVMLNGRRLGASGGEGAPVAPDLNLLPAGLIDRYELLLDGSSSIYGSDAIAGVANAILRKDFNGWEVDYVTSIPEQSNGIQNRLGLTWGKNFDRGFIGFGAEISDIEEVKTKDRSWTNQCLRNVEVDENGEIRTVDLQSREIDLVDLGSCKLNTLVGRIIVPNAGSIYYTPGISNGGWVNFSESAAFGQVPIDTDGDGQADINYRDYSLYGYQTDASLIGEVKTQNIMGYGEYTLDGDNNITPFFEVNYSRRDTYQDSGQPQLFPWVSATNPYNLCNPNGINGVDCGLAWDAMVNNPVVVDATLDIFGCDPSAGGSCDQTVGATGAVRVRPVVAVQGDRDRVSATAKQTRMVFGVKGDLPQLDFGQMSSWNFETYLSYHNSETRVVRPGIREDRLNYSLETSRIDPATGEVICGNNNGCVPINLFAPSLYNLPVGNFATQAERDYLFDSRVFNTEITQTIFSGFVNGYVYNLPAGPIAAGIGYEIRKDEINSVPDEIARDGLFFGFFSDGGAVGSKFTREAFGEIDIPIAAGYTGIEELNLNISGRITKDDFYPSSSTFSAKLGYRPIPSLLLKATLGTSYRAPNLRENFLLAQTGFNTLFDPCGLPEAALDPITGEYNPDLDRREPEVLQNCINNGVDPTALNFGGFNSYSVEIAAGGVTDIKEESADTLTYGFAWDVPNLDNFDITLGATYYQIEIDNTIVEPSGQFIVNDCYSNTNLSSAFCSRITRDAEGRMSLVDSGFINRDNQTVRGVDVNFNVDTNVMMFGQSVGLGFDIIMTHSKENSTSFLDEDGNEDFFDRNASFGFPNWSGVVNFRAEFDKYRLVWQTRYIGRVRQDFSGLDAFDDINGNSQTCLGPDANDTLCRDVGFAGSYSNHTVSINYTSDDWTFRFGIANAFNKAPPQVDNSEVSATIANIPRGYGYDINGRRLFLNIGRRF